MNQNNVLIKPKITEKSLSLTGSGVFSFEVDLKATKHQVRQVVESLFKVNVVSITSYVRAGKEVRVGKRMRPKSKPDRKTMMVKIKKGQRIDIFPS